MLRFPFCGSGAFLLTKQVKCGIFYVLICGCDVMKNLKKKAFNLVGKVVNKVIASTSQDTSEYANDSYQPNEEMKALCEDVLSLGDGINTCPHGRPIIVKISKYSMEKQFKRIL